MLVLKFSSVAPTFPHSFSFQYFRLFHEVGLSLIVGPKKFPKENRHKRLSGRTPAR